MTEGLSKEDIENRLEYIESKLDDIHLVSKELGRGLLYLQEQIRAVAGIVDLIAPGDKEVKKTLKSIIR